MLKKLLVTIFLFSGLAAFASDNYLNSIVIDNNDGQNSVILRSDQITKLKREIESPDKIVLTMKGITQSPDINTLYKNASKVKGLVIENSKNNELKVYIEAPGISMANIVFETPDSSPVTVKSVVGEGKVLWSIISIVLLLMVMRSARKTKPKTKPDINEIIKEREKAMYRNFQKELSESPKINYRLKSYSKHVLKGETIRSYESRRTAAKL